MVWFIPKLLILLVIRTLINIVRFFSLYIHVACWWAAALLLTRSMFSPVVKSSLAMESLLDFLVRKFGMNMCPIAVWCLGAEVWRKPFAPLIKACTLSWELSDCQSSLFLVFTSLTVYWCCALYPCSPWASFQCVAVPFSLSEG